MDYEVLVLDSDAAHHKIPCATSTDVENVVIGFFRGTFSKKNITMISFTINKLV